MEEVILAIHCAKRSWTADSLLTILQHIISYNITFYMAYCIPILQKLLPKWQLTWSYSNVHWMSEHVLAMLNWGVNHGGRLTFPICKGLGEICAQLVNECCAIWRSAPTAMLWTYEDLQIAWLHVRTVWISFDLLDSVVTLGPSSSVITWYLMTVMTCASMPPSQCTNFSPIDLVRSSMAATASQHLGPLGTLGTLGTSTV